MNRLGMTTVTMLTLVAGTSSRPPESAAAEPSAPVRTNAAIVAGTKSTLERLRWRRAGHEARDTPPDLTEQQIKAYLQQYQMELIREGKPPLPIQLTPEMDAQLVREGVLPPSEPLQSAPTNTPLSVVCGAYGELAERVMLLAPALPRDVPAIRLAEEHTQAEACAILKDALARAGVALVEDGEHFCLVLPAPRGTLTARAPTDVRPLRPREAASGKADSRLTFNRAPLEMYLDYAARESGRALLTAPALPRDIASLASPVELSAADCLLAVQKLLALHGIELVPIGEHWLGAVRRGGDARAAAAELFNALPLAFALKRHAELQGLLLLPSGELADIEVDLPSAAGLTSKAYVAAIETALTGRGLRFVRDGDDHITILMGDKPVAEESVRRPVPRMDTGRSLPASNG